MKAWVVLYKNCEGNDKWYTKECPDDWERWQVLEDIPIGGCGDDIMIVLDVFESDYPYV